MQLSKQKVIRKGKKPRKNNRTGNSISRIERMDHPPQINGYEIDHMKRLRFTVTNPVNMQSIRPEDILDTILVASTAVLGYDLFDIFRIIQVEVWGAAALGTPSTVAVSYMTATGDQTVHTDTSLGVKPAYVKAIPSERSLASFWTETATTDMFNITCPAGSVVDVLCHFRTTATPPTAAQNALVGANPGEVYYRGLDGLAIATTNFPPIIGVARV